MLAKYKRTEECIKSKYENTKKKGCCEFLGTLGEAPYAYKKIFQYIISS